MYTFEEVRAIVRFLLAEQAAELAETEPVQTAPVEEQKALEPKEKPKAEPKQTKKKGGRKQTLDRGKIMACYKAGWSVAEIADELRCSNQAVRDNIKKGIEEQNG